MPLVLDGLLVALLPLLAAFVLLGLSQVSSVQHGSEQSHNWLWYVTHGVVLQDLLGLASKASRAVVSHFAKAQLVIVAKFFHSMTSLARGWFAGQATFAEEIVGAVERVAGLGDATARAHAKKANSAAAAAERTATQALSRANIATRALNKYKAATNTKIHALHKSVAVTLPGEIAGVKSREGVLEKEYANLRERTKAIEDGAIKTWDWITSHPASVAAGAFAGAVSIALSRLGFGWIRCPGVGRVGNAVCGLPANLLDDLLGLLADYFILTNICDLLPILETVASDVGTPLVEALTAVGAGLCSGAEKAPPLGLPALILPAVYYTGNLTLPA